MATKKIFIYLDGKTKPPLELELSRNLNEIRDKLKQKYSDNFIFLNGGIEIPKNEEKDWILEDIIINENEKFSLNLKTPIKVDDSAPSRLSIDFKNFIKQLNNNEIEGENRSR